MANTIYSHISENRRDTVIVLAMFPVALFLLMFLLFFLSNHNADSSLYDNLIQTYNNVIGLSSGILIFSGIWMMIAYFLGDNLILTSLDAYEIKKKDNPYVYNLVENTSIAAGLPMPKLYIIDDSALNAFATGKNPETSSVVLTSGIIKKLTKLELEGVIAHEMSHIGNRDIKTMLLIVAGIGFFTFFGSVMLRISGSIRSDRENNKSGAVLFILSICFLIFGYILAPLIRLALSRKREYQADATAALITRNPIALASALRKISQNPDIQSFDNNQLASGMCIESPLKNNSILGFISNMLSTHPPIEKRIEALEKMGM